MATSTRALHAWDCFAEGEWADAAGLRDLLREHLRATSPHLGEEAADEAADRLAEAALLLDAGLDAAAALGPDAGAEDLDLDRLDDPAQQWAAVYARLHDQLRPRRRTLHLRALVDVG